jgi:hypothetical protein
MQVPNKAHTKNIKKEAYAYCDIINFKMPGRFSTRNASKTKGLDKRDEKR